MSKSDYIPSALEQWGDKISLGKKTHSKRTRFSRAKPTSTKPPKSKLEHHAKLLRCTVRKYPEVLVKVKTSKSLPQIKEHMRYISRNGKVELTDQDGTILKGVKDVDNAFYDFAYNDAPIPHNSKRREAFKVILSMPSGQPDKVHSAAIEFAKEHFGDRQFLIALHTDTERPHCHILVKSQDRDGKYMNPRKKDFQKWRETFAEKLHDQGIAANATPRWARGQYKKADHQAVKHINLRAMKGLGQIAKVTQKQIDDAKNNVPEGEWMSKMVDSHKWTKLIYKNIEKEGHLNDNDLAAEFLKAFPVSEPNDSVLLNEFEAAFPGNIPLHHVGLGVV